MFALEFDSETISKETAVEKLRLQKEYYGDIFFYQLLERTWDLTLSKTLIGRDFEELDKDVSEVSSKNCISVFYAKGSTGERVKQSLPFYIYS
jgi:hypothetical protein